MEKIKTSKHMVWRLLRKNISAGQIAGYALANLVGLVIVLCAVRFYGDVSQTLNKDDSFLRKDFLVISKQVSSLKTAGLSKNSTTFDSLELAELRQQPWVRSVGQFTSAEFPVYMTIDMGNRSMGTYMFLESIPDQYLDIAPDQWHFDARQAEADPSAITVPIIMSKDFLTLYNFGFAATRGMPQISETMMGRVPITLQIGGRGHSLSLTAHVVGFSSRLNTIAVPQAFMDWANGMYGNSEPTEPSRLIVEVNKPGDPAIDKYMKRNGYEIAGDKADNSRASYFLTVVTAVVIAIGAIISVLAFFILMLSIFLLLQKNREKLHQLMLLGYSPAQVARPYYTLVLTVNIAVLVLSVCAMTLGAMWWQPRLQDIDVNAGSPWPAIAIGVAIMLAVTVANLLTIRRLVRKNF